MKAAHMWEALVSFRCCFLLNSYVLVTPVWISKVQQRHTSEVAASSVTVNISVNLRILIMSVRVTGTAKSRPGRLYLWRQTSGSMSLSHGLLFNFCTLFAISTTSAQSQETSQWPFHYFSVSRKTLASPQFPFREVPLLSYTWIYMFSHDVLA